MQTIQIVPAVLAADKQEFHRQLTALSPLSKRIHIDIADGALVNNITVSALEIAAYFADNYRQYKENAFDFHLMVENWEETLDELADLHDYIDINIALVHYAAFSPALNPFDRLGIVFNPDEAVDTTILEDFTAAQIMTVTPGKQANPFLPENLEKIEELREWGYQGEILVDGGINDKTIPLILAQKEKPNTVCVGSYLTKAKNPQKNYDILLGLVG